MRIIETGTIKKCDNIYTFITLAAVGRTGGSCSPALIPVFAMNWASFRLKYRDMSNSGTQVHITSTSPSTNRTRTAMLAL